jgi:hypothetical protein
MNEANREHLGKFSVIAEYNYNLGVYFYGMLSVLATVIVC